MTPLEQIDFVFSYIKNKEDLSASFSTEYIWNLYVSKSPETQITRFIFNEIIRQLIDDEYIRELPIIESSQKTYHVTFKGRIFEGYVANNIASKQSIKRISDLEEENRKFQKRALKNSHQLNCLTIILAIGTMIAALYYIIEILNHLFLIYPQ